jgi:hypothetical protein
MLDQVLWLKNCSEWKGVSFLGKGWGPDVLVNSVII